jgi:O-antigen biosynthesis protein
MSAAEQINRKENSVLKSAYPDSTYSENGSPSNLNKQIQELQNQVEFLKKANKELESTLDRIMSSRSWKLTAFLRRMGHSLRKIFPLFRFKKHLLTIEPGRNVSLVDGQCLVKGISPTIIVKSLSGKIPNSWVKLNAKFESKRSPLFFLLYFGRNGEFNPQNRVWLSFANSSEASINQTTACFRIPEWTTDLRLDPFDNDFAFSVNKFEITELGKLQVLWNAISKHVTSIFSHPQIFFKKLSKAWAIYKEAGLTGLRIRLFAEDYTSNYQEWVRKYDTLDDSDKKAIARHVDKLEYKPVISVVMPVYNVAEKWLELAINSVINQIYPNWELCIADDASTEPHVKRCLEKFAALDKRIKVVYRQTNGHISEATNSALEIATGEFIALLDNDDELREHALYMVALALNQNRTASLIYSDEDKITSFGMRFNPYFKPDWNPDLFLQQNYICHLGVYRTSIVREVGGFRKGFEGAQDWDLALRISEKAGPDGIVHIPHVLYHWRVIEGSTAQSTAHKPYVLEAQKQSVKEHLERTNQKFDDVIIREDISHLRVLFPVPDKAPKVSIIIPTKDQLPFLKRCISSIKEQSQYKNYEIVIVNNNSSEQETLDYFNALEVAKEARIIHDSRVFNFSQLNNNAVAHSQDADIFAFVNNDIEAIDGEWLNEMVSQLTRKDVGAVGARLYFPNDLLQHGGVILGIGGVAGHSHKGRPQQDPGYFNRIILSQSVSAVTAACMLVKRSVFEEVGGFDEENLAVAFNDVDLCLKIRKAGYRIVYCPYAKLYHHESISRGFENTPQKFMRFEREIEVMKKRWGKTLETDPYYNPNLTLLTEDYSYSFPPRRAKEWSDV